MIPPWRHLMAEKRSLGTNNRASWATWLCPQNCLLASCGGGLVAQLCPTLATPWTVARQAPLSMGFSRQEYWSGLKFPSTQDLFDPRIKPTSPDLASRLFITDPYIYIYGLPWRYMFISPERKLIFLSICILDTLELLLISPFRNFVLVSVPSSDWLCNRE